MTVLIQSIGKLRVGDGDQVFINERAISDTLMQHGLPAPSSATYYRVIEELIAKGFIAPSENTHLFSSTPPSSSMATGSVSSRKSGERRSRRKNASSGRGKPPLLDQPSSDG